MMTSIVWTRTNLKVIVMILNMTHDNKGVVARIERRLKQVEVKVFVVTSGIKV